MGNVLSPSSRCQACSLCVLMLISKSGRLVSRRRTGFCESCNSQAVPDDASNGLL